MKWFSLLVAVFALLGTVSAGEAEAGKFRLVYETSLVKIQLTGGEGATGPLQLHYEWASEFRKAAYRNADANTQIAIQYDRHQADIRLTPQEGGAFRLWIAENQIPQLLAKEFPRLQELAPQKAPHGFDPGWRELEIQTAGVQAKKRWAQNETPAPEALHTALLQLCNLCVAVVADADKRGR